MGLEDGSLVTDLTGGPLDNASIIEVGPLSQSPEARNAAFTIIRRHTISVARANRIFDEFEANGIVFRKSE